MRNLKTRIFKILLLLAFMQGITFAIDLNSEPNWSLVEEQGLFQSEDKLVSDIIAVCDKAEDFRGCVNVVLQKLIEAAQEPESNEQVNELGERLMKRFSPYQFKHKSLVNKNKLRRMKIKNYS